MGRSLSKVTRLGVLSREIRRDYESLQRLVERSRETCNQVIAETILLGTKLIEVKRLAGHGNWCEWLAKHCPQISERTAQNYMRLSKAQHVADLQTRKSLREAYLAAGIIPMEDESPAMPVVDAAPPFKCNEDGKPEPLPLVVEALVLDGPGEDSPSPEAEIVKALSDSPIIQVKDKVDDLIQSLKPLDGPARKKVAIHLKPLVIFYHRFGKS